MLVTVRKPELIRAAMLTFATLRVGFPAARVNVWGNGLKRPEERMIEQACANVGASYSNLGATVHDEWIETLIHECFDPFWILDTDLVFFDKVEDWFAGTDTTFAGRWEPEFDEEWTGTRHMERLHTCCMYMNPSKLRGAMRSWMAQVPPPWGHTAEHLLVRQHFVPLRASGRAETLFFDTTAGLWHAGIGTKFTEAQDEAFEHLHCATYVDKTPFRGLEAAHDFVYGDPTRAKGLREAQNQFYELKQPKTRLLVRGGKRCRSN
jgi:hypothetical protein